MGCCGSSKNSKKGSVDVKEKKAYNKDCPVHSVMEPEKITEEDLKNCICDTGAKVNICSSW